MDRSLYVKKQIKCNSEGMFRNNFECKLVIWMHIIFGGCRNPAPFKYTTLLLIKWRNPQRRTSQIRRKHASPTPRGKKPCWPWLRFIGLSASARTGSTATWSRAAGGTRTVRSPGKGTRSASRSAETCSWSSGICARWGATLGKTRKSTRRGFMWRDKGAIGSDRTLRSSPNSQERSSR